MCLKVLDFGISKVIGTGQAAGNMTKTNSLLGSPLYMSPEQLRDSKNVDHRCDIWALGVVAYELLMGKTPFSADNAVALFAAIQETEPPSMCAARSLLPPDLEAVVLRCLRRHRAERFASVAELASALAPFGTSVAEAALENTKRVLPSEVVKNLTLEDSAAPLYATTTSASRLEVHVPPDAVAATAPMPMTPSTPAGGSDRPAPAQSSPLAGTGGGLADSGPVHVGRARGGLAGVLGIVGLLGAGIAAVVLLPRGGGAGAFGVVTRGNATSIAAAASAPSTGVAPDAGEPVATLPSASSPPPAPPVPSAAESSAPASAPSAPPPSARVASSSPARTPRTPSGAVASVEPPATPAPAVPAPNCTPPYEFDSSGKKIWKRACL